MIDPFGERDAGHRLLNSEPAVATPWHEALIRRVLYQAVKAGLSLPRPVVIRWRQGAPGSADGAVAREENGLVVYLRATGATWLERTAHHECWHLHCQMTGRAEAIGLELEESEARAYADRMLLGEPQPKRGAGA